jgi:hypothetical protein
LRAIARFDQPQAMQVGDADAFVLRHRADTVGGDAVISR